MTAAPVVVERSVRVRTPFAGDALLAFLAPRVIAGVEAVDHGVYTRTLRLAGGPALVSVRPRAASLHVRALLADAADADAAVAVARRIFDAAARPQEVDAVLGVSPLLTPLVAERPGLRSPGTADGFELLVRAITGQQVSVAGAHTTLVRIAATHGDEWKIVAPVGHSDSTRLLFPRPEVLAEADPTQLGMPHARGRAIVAAAQACADGLQLAPGADSAETRARLLALPGVGPWTADYVSMRALGDRDAFLPGDLGVRHALARLGGTVDDAEAWRPFRAHAVHHLWATA